MAKKKEAHELNKNFVVCKIKLLQDIFSKISNCKIYQKIIFTAS
jgi:hypothetical protein